MWKSNRLVQALALAAVLAVAAALRIIFPEAIEYKPDESGYFEDSRRYLASHSWPWVGPLTSTAMPSPGMGVGVFTVLTWVSGALTPPELARAAQLVNVAAVFSFAAFALACIPRDRREPWLWACALWGLNPIAVILERKIWPVSVLPIFTVALIATWWYRRRFPASVAWGACGALMAQVHIGAVLLVLSLATWTAASDWRSANWPGWLLGSAIGSLTAIPWLIERVQAIATGQTADLPHRVPNPSLYLRWITQPFGLGAEYTLGRKHMLDFLRGPIFMDHPTYLIALLHATIVALMIVAAARTLPRMLADRNNPANPALVSDREAKVLIGVAMIGYLGSLTLANSFGVGNHRHYLIVVAPLMALWAARFVLRGDVTSDKRVARYLLAGFCVAEATVAFALLSYISSTGLIRGEFGPTWQYQRQHCQPEDVGHPACLAPLKG